MKALILFESYFGNTEKVARACADGLAGKAEVSVVRVNEVLPDALTGIDFLLLASPTRGFRPGTATQAFLKALTPGSLAAVKAAAFDTRIDPDDIKSGMLRFMVKSFGYAGKAMQAALAKAGAVMVAEPEGFFVTASEGPLKEGELERAGEWIKGLI